MPSDPDLRTLIIKHLPPECTDEDCKQLLTSLGALSVTFMGNSGPLNSNEHAWKIIEGLHQKTVLGRRIAVEFLNDPCNSCMQPNQTPPSSKATDPHMRTQPKHSCLSEFAPIWDRSFQVPSNLVYHYPPPTDQILTNIVRTLVSCSAFYTQVLHLMNRMHLPPPFDDPDLFPGTWVVVSDRELVQNHLAEPKPCTEEPASLEQVAQIHEMDLSSGPETELESDESDMLPRKRIIPKRRRIRTSLPAVRPSKALTRNLSKSTATTKSQKVAQLEDLFEPASKPKKPGLLISQTIQLNDQAREIPDHCDAEGGFGVIEPPSEALPKHIPLVLSENFRLRKSPPHSPSSSSLVEQPLATVPPTHPVELVHSNSDNESILTFSLDELRQRCVGPESRNNYAVFARGYDPGQPTSRLYIKNLASLVQESDLFQIYGLFSDGPVCDPQLKRRVRPESSFQFSIRLLTEGRMKGQAFVSLPCESTAKQALDVTNGFMLHDKPMVVQFARGAKAKVDDRSLILPQAEN